MANITGTVLGQTNMALPNVTVTLIGEVAPQITLADANGNFNFSGLEDGDYKIVATRKESDQSVQQMIRLSAGQDSKGTLLVMNMAKPNTVSDDDNKFVPLKYIQYIFLIAVGCFYFYALIANGITDLTVEKLSNLESARGVITYFVAVTTIAMAAILMLAAIMTGGRDLDKRFALGKEILTLLIGVLGTIIGFYYGSTAKSETNTAGNPTNSAAIKVESVLTDPASPAIGKPFSAIANITGGTPPYNYSLTVTPTGTANPVLGKSSADGKVNETLTIQDNAKPGSATLIIAGKDTKSSSFTGIVPISIIK